MTISRPLRVPMAIIELRDTVVTTDIVRGSRDNVLPVVVSTTQAWEVTSKGPW